MADGSGAPVGVADGVRGAEDVGREVAEARGSDVVGAGRERCVVPAASTGAAEVRARSVPGGVEAGAEGVLREARDAAGVERSLVADGGGVPASFVAAVGVSGALRARVSPPEGSSPSRVTPSPAPPATSARPAAARRARPRLLGPAERWARRPTRALTGTAVRRLGSSSTAASCAAIHSPYARTASTGVPQPGQVRAPLRCLRHGWQ